MSNADKPEVGRDAVVVGASRARCAMMAATSMARRISNATPAIARCSRRSRRSCRRGAVWYSSNLKRTPPDRGGDLGCGFPESPRRCLGKQPSPNNISATGRGMNRAAFVARPSRPAAAGFADINVARAPAARASWTFTIAFAGAIDRINVAQAGQGRHRGGPMAERSRAAVGLATRRSTRQRPRV